MDGSGVLTFRVAQLSADFVGNPNWQIPGRDSSSSWAIERFERSGVSLPKLSTDGPYYTVEAHNCGGADDDGPYCWGDRTFYNPAVCPDGFTQISYDTCCNASTALESSTDCLFASTDGGLF